MGDQASRGAPPPGVAERLDRLRALVVVDTDADTRRRLARDRPTSVEPFAVAVARRLAELRALSDLANHLHRRG
jgi:hypothetical protein